jgi:menaquinone-dependent protoporphyrinogen IX oxidase
MEEDAESHLRQDYMPATLIPRINLQGFQFFAGKLLYDDINLEERWTLSVRYDGMREPNQFNGDYREWDRIEEWARSVTSQIRTFA